MKSTLLAACLFAVAITAQAGTFRFHRYLDDSVLVDDDEHGTRLVMPEDYHRLDLLAEIHFGEVNPDSFRWYSDHVQFVLSFDVPPQRYLSLVERSQWAAATGKKWWEVDILNWRYGVIETTARGISAQNNTEANKEFALEKTSESIPDPPPRLVQSLAFHRVWYSDKATTASGDRTWHFKIGDPKGRYHGYRGARWFV